MTETHWYSTKSFYKAKEALYNKDNFSYIVIVGSHGSGKSTILSGLTDFCPIRPLAYLFGCHPEHRKDLFRVLFADINTIPWNKGGIFFADEYDDNDDFLEIINFACKVNSKVITTCHPENLHRVMSNGEKLGKHIEISIKPIDSEEAQGIWLALAKRYKREDLIDSPIQSKIYEYSKGLVNRFMALSHQAMKFDDKAMERDVIRFAENYERQDNLDKRKRAGIRKRGYVLRFPNGTESNYRINTPTKDI